VAKLAASLRRREAVNSQLQNELARLEGMVEVGPHVAERKKAMDAIQQAAAMSPAEEDAQSEVSKRAERVRSLQGALDRTTADMALLEGGAEGEGEGSTPRVQLEAQLAMIQEDLREEMGLLAAAAARLQSTRAGSAANGLEDRLHAAEERCESAVRKISDMRAELSARDLAQAKMGIRLAECERRLHQALKENARLARGGGMGATAGTYCDLGVSPADYPRPRQKKGQPLIAWIDGPHLMSHPVLDMVL
jgi:chromosome segregation ATPase